MRTHCSKAKEISGVKIFRYEGALFFASFDYFRTKLIQKTGLDPMVLAKQQKQAAKQSTGPNTISETVIDHSSAPAGKLQSSSLSAENVVSHGGQVRAIENANGITPSQSEVIFESRSAFIQQKVASCAAEETQGCDSSNLSKRAPDDISTGPRYGYTNDTDLSGQAENVPIYSIVLECTGWSYIDVTALKALVEVRTC